MSTYGAPSWYKGFAKVSGNTMFILGLVLVFGIGVVTGALMYERFWGNKGRIIGIGIDLYWDAALTDPIEVGEVFDWGDLEAGQSYSDLILWCHNNGSIPVYLSMYTQNFNPPEAQQHLVETWDYNGIALPVNGTRRIIFTLSVDPDSPQFGLFQYDTYIVAEDARTP